MKVQEKTRSVHEVQKSRQALQQRAYVQLMKYTTRRNESITRRMQCEAAYNGLVQQLQARGVEYEQALQLRQDSEQMDEHDARINSTVRQYEQVHVQEPAVAAAVELVMEAAETAASPAPGSKPAALALVAEAVEALEAAGAVSAAVAPEEIQELPSQAKQQIVKGRRGKAAKSPAKVEVKEEQRQAEETPDKDKGGKRKSVGARGRPSKKVKH